MNFFASSTRGAQLFQITALLGTIFAFTTYGVSANNLPLILLGYFIYGCLGIVVTYHRYLTHNSYQTRPLLVKIFSVLGCFAGTGSPLAWVAIHINHHLKSDKPNDPHSPLYKGINIFKLDYESNLDPNTKWRMRKLITDKFQQFLHRYYFLILAFYSLILFLIGGFWLMVFLHWAPALITGIMSNVVNYVGHMPNWFGNFRTYKLSDQSANSWLWAIPSWGEAWHNNHHRYPRRSYFGNHWYQIDISGLIIKAIETKQ
jgi:stearoyl-CoA desaturase (Delta-9 desaturase)